MASENLAPCDLFAAREAWRMDKTAAADHVGVTRTTWAKYEAQDAAPLSLRLAIAARLAGLNPAT